MMSNRRSRTLLSSRTKLARCALRSRPSLSHLNIYLNICIIHIRITVYLRISNIYIYIYIYTRKPREARQQKRKPDQHLATGTASSSTARAPPFSNSAAGMPKDWNEKPGAKFSFGKRTKRRCEPCADGAEVKVEQMLDFLRQRPGPHGTQLLDRLGVVEPQTEGWFRIPFAGATAGTPSLVRLRAWHGCKLEALYSILYHGRLCESNDRERGHRFFAKNGAGVYSHGDNLRHKAEHYIRFMPLCGDGVYWAAQLELLVDPRHRVNPGERTDQWIHRAEGVQIVAVWVCGRTMDTLVPCDEIGEAWVPELEANPKDYV
jgi:hypothetical protein